MKSNYSEWMKSVEKWVRCIELADQKKLELKDFYNTNSYCNKYGKFYFQFYSYEIFISCPDCPLYNNSDFNCCGCFYELYSFFKYHSKRKNWTKIQALCRGMLNEILCNPFTNEESSNA